MIEENQHTPEPEDIQEITQGELDEIYESDDDAESCNSEEFESILQFYQNEIKGRSHARGSRLPKCVSVLVGEANKLYLERCFEEAISICCEAIKIFPENPEPYHLLSVPNF